MTTQTLTLTDFLLARIAEQHALATALLNEHTSRDWEEYQCRAGMFDEPAGNFAEAMTPSWLLAECEAKRRLVAEHSSDLVPSLNAFGTKVERVWCRTCHSTSGYTDGRWCTTLRALALPYADHPDFREEWR